MLGMMLFSRFLVLPTDMRAVFCGSAAAQTVPVSVSIYLDVSVIIVDPVTWMESRHVPTGKPPSDRWIDSRSAASHWAKKRTVIETKAKKVVHQASISNSPHGAWTRQHAPR